MDPILRRCSIDANSSWSSMVWIPESSDFNFCFVLLISCTGNLGLILVALYNVLFSNGRLTSLSRITRRFITVGTCTTAMISAVTALIGLVLSQLDRQHLESDVFTQLQFTFGLGCMSHLCVCLLHASGHVPSQYGCMCMHAFSAACTANYAMLVVQTAHLACHTMLINAAILTASSTLYLIVLVTSQCVVKHNIHQEEGSDDGEQLLQDDESISIAGDDQASILSRLCFCWTAPLLSRGYHGRLQVMDDLLQLPSRLDVDVNYCQLVKANRNHTNINIVKAAWHSIGMSYLLLGTLKFLADNLNFVGPVLLHELVQFMMTDSASLNTGYAYAGGMMIASLLSALCSWHFNYSVQVLALRLKCSLQMAAYHKLISTKQCSLANSQMDAGRIINLVSTDVDRITGFCNSFHAVWSLPVQLVVGTLLIYRELGISFLAVIIVSLVLLPLNKWLAIRLGTLSQLMMAEKDKRVRLMTEVLFGIRTIKLSGWQRCFIDRLTAVRHNELGYVRQRKYLDAICVYLWASAPALISLSLFVTYSLTGHQLTAPKVFTCLALVNILIMPLNAFPWALTGLIESWVSVKRLQALFDVPERLEQLGIFDDDDQLAVAALDCHIGWNTTRPVISRLSMQVDEGHLVVITGVVGSGKSSLLLALCGELDVLDGNLVFGCDDSTRHGIAYCGQQPWLQAGTVRDNILFGARFDQSWYDRVVKSCALTTDIEAMPNGDQTLVSEQGVTLSGGQKSRLALARAVYQNCQIYLLDDPFSSLDASVAQQIWDQVIIGLLKQKGRTVILATHHEQLIRHADYILRLNQDGTMKQYAPPSADRTFRSQMSQDDSLQERSYESPENDQQTEVVLVLTEEKQVGSVDMKVYKAYVNAVGKFLSLFVMLSLAAMQASQNVTDLWLAHWVGSSSVPDDNTTVAHPNSYLHPSMPSIVLLPVVTYTTSMTSMVTSNASTDVQYNLQVYAGLALINTLCTLIRSFAFAYAGIQAAKIMHSKMLNNVLSATVNFFDITPVGRIVNRFSSDVYMLDESLPFQANIVLMFVFKVLGAAIMMCLALPAFMLVLMPVAAVYYVIQRYYRYSNSELKRLSSISVSPLNTHITDTINGLVTVRAFKHTQRFCAKMTSVLTDSIRAQYNCLVLGQWLAVRLQLLGVVTVTAVSFIAVLQHQWHWANAGLVGLALSYGLSFTSLLNGLLSSFAETEKEMVAVERVDEYIHNELVEHDNDEQELPEDWPYEGRVDLNGVCLSYGTDMPLALDDLTLTIKPGEKLAIVGRTGSGKSSLLLALFRCVPIKTGAIYIDNVDISTVPLNKLRSSMVIIPQTPFLYTGTLRDNIDVLGHCNEDELMLVIGYVGLEGLLTRIGGLNAELGDRGAETSMGERQLICLARALLTKAKVTLQSWRRVSHILNTCTVDDPNATISLIVCIDEATAHVDKGTDDRIQSVIRCHLSECTVICVAHRLSTIADFDRVVVMHSGHVQRICTPQSL